MSRKIKFRIWDNIRKTMHYPGEFDEETGWDIFLDLHGDVWLFNMDDLESNAGDVDGVIYEKMQFSGFTNNDGCSFYERDICTYSDCNGDIKQGIIRYSTDMMCFGFICHHMSFTPAYKTKFWVKLGTEFENPELLEKQ